MLMPDVNVLIYAHREDAHREHLAYAGWIRKLALGAEPFALSSLALGGLTRIVTNPRVFTRPSTHDEVFGFVRELLDQPTARLVSPGPRHWEVFEELCRASGASGKLAADAFHAALAIEHGCVWVTTDSDFRRFPSLRHRHPLEPDALRLPCVSIRAARAQTLAARKIGHERRTLRGARPHPPRDLAERRGHLRGRRRCRSRVLARRHSVAAVRLGSGDGRHVGLPGGEWNFRPIFAICLRRSMRKAVPPAGSRALPEIGARLTG